MAFRTLISTSALALHLGDSQVVVVDCRFQLADTSWGEAEYQSAHIPGAVYAHLDRDLTGPKSGTNGRHPLPTVDEAAAAFGRLGIGNDVQVIAYDQDNGMFASRLWWMLRWLGHDAVAVLDGGFAKWTAEGRETTSGIESAPAHTFVAAPRAEMIADASAVSSMATDASSRLIDARAPERFRGDIEPIDRVAGHIPGASNHFYLSNVCGDGSFRTPDELRADYRAAIAGVPPDRIVCYCGSGVTACHTVLALEHAGISGAKLYPGSWSEWSSDPERPVAKG